MDNIKSNIAEDVSKEVKSDEALNDIEQSLFDFSELMFKPLKVDEDQAKCGWDKATIQYYSQHASKIKKMIFNNARVFNRPQLQIQDIEDIYQDLGNHLYENDDYDITKACESDSDEITPIEVYISQCIRTCVQRYCTRKQKVLRNEQPERVFEDQDGKQSSQFDFVEDSTVREEFLNLDYDLERLCESYECYRYKFGCDIFQLIYVKLLLIQHGKMHDNEVYDNIMTILGVNKKQLQAVQRMQQSNDVLVSILKAANDIGFRTAVGVLENFVYGAKDIKQAVNSRI